MRDPIGVLLWLSLGAALSLSPAASPAAERLTVFAAASTSDAISEIAGRYESEGAEPPRLSFAASSTLARQIDNGAPADVYLSASRTWMDYLAERGRIAPGTRRTLLGNRLVLVAPEDSALDIAVRPGFALAEALGSGRLAMGDPDHVPAGVYGKQALEALGVWSELAGRVARAANVRAALALVARGEAAAGITYATDAAISDEVRVVDAFPADSHAPITYDVAIVAGRANPASRAFVAYLHSPAARAVFVRRGFTVAEGG